jgi:hypothetical protein
VDQPDVDTVGEETRLLLGEKAPLLELFIAPCPPNIGRPGFRPCGAWKGFTPEGTLRRRPGVRVPGVYMLWDRE